MDVAAALQVQATMDGVEATTTGLLGMAGAAEKAEKATKKVGNETRNTGVDVSRLRTMLAGLQGGFRQLAALAGTFAGALVGALSIHGYIQLADAWSDMQSKVGAAVKDMAAAPALMERMVSLANASYSPIQQTVEVYTRAVAVMRDLGYTAAQTADYTEALNHALVITATRGEQAASVQNALSRAMAVGKLNGDGLETVLASGARVAEALAKELGTTINGLRGLASEGKITSKVIATALLASLEELRSEAAEMPATVADGMVRIQTGVQALIGVFDQVTGSSGALAWVLVSVGDALANMAFWISDNADLIQELFVNVIGVAISATTFLLAKYTLGLGMMALASVQAWLATVTLTGAVNALALALLRTGIGVLVVGVGLLIGQFFKLVGAVGSVGAAFALVGEVAAEVWAMIAATAGAAWARVDAGLKGLQASAVDAFAGILTVGVEFANRYIGIFRGAVEAVIAIWGVLPGAIGDLAFQAANSLVEAVGWMLTQAAKPIDLFLAGINKVKVALGGTPIELIGEVKLPGLDNPYAGQAESAGKSAAEAFNRGFNAESIATPGIIGALGERADDLRGQAEGYREAARILDKSAARPLTAWEKLKELIFGTSEEVEAVTTAAVPAAAAMDELGGAGAGAAKKTKEAIDELKEATEDLKGTISSAFVGFVTGAKSFKQALSEIISKLAEMLATKGFENIWGALGGDSFLSGALGFLGFAKGGVFNHGAVQAFADGGVVTRPTTFDMKRGTGLMGEAGPEAILPLKRAADGKLGVASSGASRPTRIELHAPEGFTATQLDQVEGVSVRVVERAAPMMVKQSVAATGRAMASTKTFGKRTS